ncbi:FecCD family ABC transporter permease [Lacrimispora sp. JR3]|uniref:FecCD family ABC transporter permease n=1 Tax=Lacrimispora sinapis TaxID=3111456 RepID=UPI0037485C63
MERIFRSKQEKITFLYDTRNIQVLLGLLLVLLVLIGVSLAAGSQWFSLTDLYEAVRGENSYAWLVIMEMRLPRILVAVLAGASLSVAGAILQGIIRNPLASPDIIGISNGASFAAILFLTVFSGKISIHWLPVAALCGAGGVSFLIYVLAWNQGIRPTRMVLIGIGISAVTGALTTFMITISPSASASKAYVWMTGSVYGSSWRNIFTLLPWTAVLFPIAFLYSRHLALQEMGDDIAAALGSPVQRHRAVLIFISVALSASSVAVAGAVGFVGLIGPHIARKLCGLSMQSVLPASAFTGGILVLLADTVARTLFLPKDIPVGVLTAAVGAPFFIYLLFRNRNK